MLPHGGGDGLAVNMSGQHVCVSPAPPAVWVFWHLIWHTESLDRGLILVCRFSFVSSRVRIPVAALVYKVGCTCVTLYCSQMGKRLSQRRATCTGGMIITFIIFRFHKDNKLE
jgi:hypothetical protein